MSSIATNFTFLHKLSCLLSRLLLARGSYRLSVDHALTLVARKRAKTGYGFLTGMDCGVNATSKYFPVLPTPPSSYIGRRFDL
jgi:hypothetical protein